MRFGDAANIPRGLCELRLGDGVSGGLPGNDGAHTICSGVTELLSMDRFSLPSIIRSMLTPPRICSPETLDENELARSRCNWSSVDNRRTDKSNGVVDVIGSLKRFRKVTLSFHYRKTRLSLT